MHEHSRRFTEKKPKQKTRKQTATLYADMNTYKKLSYR